MSEPAPVPNRAAITVALMLATVMTALDSTIVAVALPHVQGSLSAASDEIVWVLTSYIIAAAMVTPVTGWLANRFGLKRVFLMAVAGFTVASMLCGLATNLPELVLFRFLQGSCGAFILPLTQTTLFNINPPSRHASAMALWSMGSLMGSLFGPVVGGYLTEIASWRWCFFVNLPVGALVVLGIWSFMPADRPKVWRRLDVTGFSALIVAVGALQLMLDRGSGQDWFASREICAELVIAAIAFWIFLAHTATTRHPFIDLAVIRNRNFAASGVFMFIVHATVFGTLTMLPQMTQGLMGYPVLLSGVTATPRAVGVFFSMLAAPWLMARFGARKLLAVGTVGTAIALWQMTQYDLSMTIAPLLSAGFTQGVAQGFIMVPATAVAFATLDSENLAEAAALMNSVRNVAAALGISGLQALLTANTQVMHASLAAQATPSDPMFSWAIGRAFSPDTAAGAEALNAQITQQAAMVAYIDDFRLLFVATLLSTPLVLLLRPTQRQDIDVEERQGRPRAAKP